MSTDIATRDHAPTTELAISSDQTSWNDKQLAALRHLGVDGASEAELGVFFHECARTGLDPFTRQIYMIGRWSPNGTKYSHQTGIDGYRLIGRRAAAAAGHTISLAAPQWADPNGGWHDVWSKSWGTPLAARVTIHRNGQPFTGLALFDEYAQTKRGGGLTQMWEQRPAGQIAKCAEALAWRMAFPQDLSGLYTAEEMAQADNPVPVNIQQPIPQASLKQPAAEQVDGPKVAGVVKSLVVEAFAHDKAAAKAFWLAQGYTADDNHLMETEEWKAIVEAAEQAAKDAAEGIEDAEVIEDTPATEGADLFDEGSDA